VVLLALVGCFGEDGGLARCSPAENVNLIPSKVAAQPGEKIRFNLPADAKGLTVAWKTDAYPAGGTLSDDGLFTAPSKPDLYRVSAEYTRADGTDVSANAWVSVEPADVKPEGSQSASEGVSFSVDESPTVADPASLETIFEVVNGLAVSNGGKPVSFSLTTARRVREISTYHWNDAKGSKALGTITLSGHGGTQTFKATRTMEGQGGVPNAYWIVDLDVMLQPGTYKISDSDPSTWAQNAETKGKGMTWVKAEKQ
jgi:hypothetical protein